MLMISQSYPQKEYLDIFEFMKEVPDSTLDDSCISEFKIDAPRIFFKIFEYK